MDCKIYVIYDKVAEEYGPLFEAVNDNVAARSFVQTIRNQNLSEYQLVCVGERHDYHLGDDIEDPKMHDCIISGMSCKEFKPYIVDIAVKQSADKSYSIVEVSK